MLIFKKMRCGMLEVVSLSMILVTIFVMQYDQNCQYVEMVTKNDYWRHFTEKG